MNTIEEKRLWEIYTSSLILFYKFRQEIYKCREWFLAKTPVTIYGLKAPIAIGTMLRIWDSNEELFCHKCSKCGGTAYVYSYAGNPMTGTTAVSCKCFSCGADFNTRTGGFIARTKLLGEYKHKYQQGYGEANAVTLEKLVKMLSEKETKDSDLHANL